MAMTMKEALLLVMPKHCDYFVSRGERYIVEASEFDVETFAADLEAALLSRRRTEEEHI